MEQDKLSLTAARELLADGFPKPTIEEARQWLLEKYGIDCTFASACSNWFESYIRKKTDKGFVDTGLRGCDGTREGAVSDAIYTALAFIHEPQPAKRWWQRLAARFGIIIETEEERRYWERTEFLKAPVSC